MDEKRRVVARKVTDSWEVGHRLVNGRPPPIQRRGCFNVAEYDGSRVAV